jgi:selenoprotein W-related protein
MEPTGKIAITYCTQCHWLLRASWMSSELLTTFQAELAEVALRPGTGGIFTVTANDEVVWDRRHDGGFPEITELKRRVRDVIAPERTLGHVDRVAKAATAAPEAP